MVIYCVLNLAMWTDIPKERLTNRTTQSSISIFIRKQMRLFFNNERDIIRYAAVKNIRIYDNCLEFLRDRNTLKNFYFMQLFKIFSTQNGLS